MKQLAEDARGLGVLCAAAIDFHGEVAEVGHDQRLQQQAAVGVGIHSHTQAAFGSNIGEIGAEMAFLVEELIGLVAAHPFVELAQVLRVLLNLVERNLVGAPGVLNRLAVDKPGTGPAFGSAHDEHGPRGTGGRAVFPGGLLNCGDAVEHGVKDRGCLLVHDGRIVAFQCEGFVAVSAH